jgi:DNA polymerase-1
MKLMILDGNSVVNRAFYGVRPLSTREGLYTNAIFGFLNILEKLRQEETPDALCVAFDLKAPTFRHKKYDGYKATRHPMPDELCMQMPYLKQVLTAMRIPIYQCEGWEADDILGTVGRLCSEDGWDCVIVTGDRDSLQLLGEHVRVKLVASKAGQTISTLYDEAAFREEYGFAPKRLVDLKGLMGDSSDNLPGVPGVGPKTASELLKKYGTLDGVYAHLDEDKENLRKKLEDGREKAYLSFDLAAIRLDAPIEFVPEKNFVQEPDEPALYALFKKLEFVRLIERYHLHEAHAEKPEMAEGTCVSENVDSLSRARELFTAFAKEPYVCVLAAPDLSRFAVDGCGQMSLFSREKLGADYSAALAGFFGGKIKKATHDCKSLQRMLLEQGVEPSGFVFDTAVAAYLLDATAGSYELEKLTVQYLGFELPKPPAGVTEDAAVLAELFSRTSAVDALYDPLREKLQNEGMDKLFSEIDLPLCAVLADMEREGVLVDQLALISFGTMLSGRMDAAQKTVYECAGEEFNINSPKQLGEILFDKLKLPAGKKTKNGWSTNADVLEKLRGRNPIVDAIFDYRMLSKLKSTYADGLVKQIAPDGRIHTTFQNTVTATGRLSSTDPNLQNIPVRTQLGSEMRKMFVPKDGCVFVDADYSQIELRVLAHVADDKRMQEAFLSGMDIHTATASQVFGVEPNDVTPLLRRRAKAVNFGIVYGISEFSLSEDIGVTRKEAKEYIDAYLANYAGVRQYMKDVVEAAKKDGYVTTLYGRRRYLPELKSDNYNIRSFGERVALNTPIQGTAADIIKIAMLRVSKALREEKLRAKLLLQVHDELIVECPLKEAEEVTKIVTREMQNVITLRVPLVAEAKQGASWYEAK